MPPPPRPGLGASLSRRQILVGGLTATAALATPAYGQNLPQTAIQSVLGEGQRFEQTRIGDLARLFAKRPFVPPASTLPDPFNGLTYEQYVAIRALPPRIWTGEGRGYAIEPLHRGFVFNNPVSLYIVEDGAIQRLGYDKAKFEFGRLPPPGNIGDIGFSGFRVFSSPGVERPWEAAIFQGATFFRAIARGQNFGVMARTLTLRPAETRGEEIPIFRAFWIERPNPGADALVIHALLDSESVTGAIRFTLRSGEMTIIDVEASLFPRVNLDHVGIAGMTSTFLFGPNSRAAADDVRMGVYESKGLQILNGQGEWIWRPLTNPTALQISAFLDADPRGFGLLQRDRDFAAFEDNDQRYERRPSLWVEALGDWSEGSVHLIEIPTDSEVNDNVIAYWRPRQAIAAGAEVSFAYRQYWCWSPPERPKLAWVTQTRSGKGTSGRRRRFFVDFTGDALAEARALVELKPALSASVGSIGGVRVWTYPERKSLRVGFELDPGNEQSSELRLVLEAAGKPMSETWLYRWTP